MSEKLSALIDNELDELERARLLKELDRESELVELWSRYHIIGRAMRWEEISWSRDLPDRVIRALNAETQTGRDESSTEAHTPLLASAGRFAIAASVVGVLLVGGLIVKLYEDAGTDGGYTPSTQQTAFNNDATRWEDVDPQVEDALNALLVEHGEFAPASGMNGLTAYTKFVAYDSR